MEHILQKLRELGFDTDSGIAYTGSPGKYISALARYAGSSGDIIAGIREHLGSGDMERYTIAVHAAKSNSKMIGHTGLFRGFESLEAAGKRNDTAFIDANNDRILEYYALTAEQLAPFTEKPAGDAAPVLSRAEAEDTAEKLLEALDDFDDEASAELAAKLSGYPFGETDMEMLGRAEKHIGSFMYDEAAELIRELLDRLRDK